MAIEDYSNEELEREIERRKLLIPMPIFCETVTKAAKYDKLRDYLEEWKRKIPPKGGYYYDNLDTEHCFKFCINLVYGSEFFRWYQTVVKYFDG